MVARRYESPVRDAATEETRRRIIRAARKVLAGPKGYGGMSLEGVAKVASVTRLTIYNHFGTKRCLLEALFDERAKRGGLHRIADVMAMPDPHQAVLQIADIFCAFWASDARILSRVWAATVGDPGLAEGIHARNERRRNILSILVGRMVARGAVHEDRSKDLVDLLFALTSLSFYGEISSGNKDSERVALLVTQAVKHALIGAGWRG